MFNTLKIYVGFILLLTIFSCAKNEEGATMEMASKELGSTAPEEKTTASIQRKLIKDGHLSFETDAVEATRNVILIAVNKYKGYISSDQEFKSPGRKSNTIVIRVPSSNFDQLLNDATKGVERFDNKEINVKDVTEEFLDIQARVKTKKELELRYIDLLKKARNVTEILEIEKQIGLLRAEIESIEGRLKYLEDQVSFSTLTMTFYETVPNESAFGKQFQNGFRNGIDNLMWFFVGLTNIWPFIVIIIGLVYGFLVYRKRK